MCDDDISFFFISIQGETSEYDILLSQSNAYFKPIFSAWHYSHNQRGVIYSLERRC